MCRIGHLIFSLSILLSFSLSYTLSYGWSWLCDLFIRKVDSVWSRVSHAVRVNAIQIYPYMDVINLCMTEYMYAGPHYATLYVRATCVCATDGLFHNIPRVLLLTHERYDVVNVDSWSDSPVSCQHLLSLRLDSPYLVFGRPLDKEVTPRGLICADTFWSNHGLRGIALCGSLSRRVLHLTHSARKKLEKIWKNISEVFPAYPACISAGTIMNIQVASLTFETAAVFALFHLSGAFNAAVGITSGPGPGALFAFMLFAVMTSSVGIVISSRMLYSWPYGVEPCYVKQTNSLGSTIVHIESCITEISLRSNYVERKHSSVAKASANLVLFYSWYDILCRL